MPTLVQNGRDSPTLISRPDNRAAHNAEKIGTFVQQLLEFYEVALDVGSLGGFVRKIEQCRRVAPGHPFNDRIVRCHVALTVARLGA